MDEVDRILEKYRTDCRFESLFRSPEFGGKRPAEIMVAMFLKQYELCEYMAMLKRDIHSVEERLAYVKIIAEEMSEKLSRK